MKFEMFDELKLLKKEAKKMKVDQVVTALNDDSGSDFISVKAFRDVGHRYEMEIIELSIERDQLLKKFR